MTIDGQQEINEAFENYLGSFLVDSIRAIEERYGQDIAGRVREIYDDAMDCPTVDWSAATMDSALGEIHRMLDAKYPWLSVEARKKVNYAYIMCWK